MPYQDDTVRRPIEFGVPVLTLMGYYDPEGKRTGSVTPLLVGTYGHVYDHPMSFPCVESERCCFLEIFDAEKTYYDIPLTPRRKSRNMNAFQLNINWKFVDQLRKSKGSELLNRLTNVALNITVTCKHRNESRISAEASVTNRDLACLGFSMSMLSDPEGLVHDVVGKEKVKSPPVEVVGSTRIKNMPNICHEEVL